MDLIPIANKLKENKENIILVYAFNATGKTRACVEYKNITKAANDGKHAGVYYNAYSEDLFVWDNDEEHNNADIKLQVKDSSLDKLHSFLIADPELVKEKLTEYNPKYDFTFNAHKDPERGIESITFFKETKEGNKTIKISRGEERIFIWCFFLALFEVDGWADVQNAHFFIDDPVSSMDEHNVFVTANTIYEIIEKNYLNKRIIITTHHIGLFSILADRLKRGEKSDAYKNLTKLFTLSTKDGEFVLNSPNNDVFLYHLHLLQTLEIAIKKQLYRYHFVLMRQVLENIGSFLGTGRIKHTLEQIEVTNPDDIANTINSLSHKDAYSFQYNKMSSDEELMFKNVFAKIQEKYKFVLHAK